MDESHRAASGAGADAVPVTATATGGEPSAPGPAAEAPPGGSHGAGEHGGPATPTDGAGPAAPVASRWRRARGLRRAAARVRAAGARRPGLRVALFATVGAVVAVALLGRTPAKIGPFETTMAVRPSLTGHTVVHLAPLGTIVLDTHDWPLALDLRVDEIAVADAERIASNPREIDRLGEDAADEVRSALVGLVVRVSLVALVGGVAGALAARLSWRSAAGGAGMAALVVATLGAGTAATFEAGAVAEPRYTGLLSRAPAAVGDVEAVLERFGEYRAQLSDLVDNMATLYLAGSELPTVGTGGDMIRVLHVSDIHLNPQAFDMIERLTEQFGVDAVVDTGDLTDWGTDPETQLVDRIGELDVPYVYVRGNHDSRRTQEAVAGQPNAVVLDGDGETVAGLRFWGIGDPRYTPDKTQQEGGSERERAEAFAPVVAERLAADEPSGADVVLVHDQRMAGALGGEVPLVLAGHTHEPAEDTLDPPEPDQDEGDEGDEGTVSAGGGTGSGRGEVDRDGAEDGGGTLVEETLLLVEGSTGGAGLRGLQGEEPEPLTASILYFDPDTGRLVAYDRITVAWLGDAGATIDRHIVDRGDEPAGDERSAPADTP